MDSFFSNPLTVLCAAKIPEADKDEWPEWTDAFLTAHSEALLITPAFQQYLDSIRDTYGRHARLLLSDKVYLAKQLPAWMEAHCANSRLHTLGTVCLMHVVTSSRKAESRRSPAELLCDVLSTTFFESGQLDTLFRCLK